MEIKIIYKEIAEMTKKSEGGIKQMAKNNPAQLELLKIGALCKKFDMDFDDVVSCIKLLKKDDIK